MMGLQDNADIKLAIHIYKTSLQSLKRGVDITAFKAGTFARETYIENSRYTKKVTAQVGLFETIYLILDEKQKVAFHKHMAAHQHFLSLDKLNPSGEGHCRKSDCKCGGTCQCDGKKSCQGGQCHQKKSCHGDKHCNK